MVTYVLGVCLMMASDCYKAAMLSAKPGLITGGPFRLCRHPNYLGEMMIYGGFAGMVPHLYPKLVLVWVWVQLFATNMYLKEASMSRHAGWKAYCATTPMLLPNLAVLFGLASSKEAKAN
jgi:protein-S-isoprenylcysteine O-methyltransferase Ste14